MAKLSDDSRLAVRSSFSRTNTEDTPFSKAELSKVVGAIDDLIDANVAAAQAALSSAGVTVTDKQLDIILRDLAQKRFEERA